MGTTYMLGIHHEVQWDRKLAATNAYVKLLKECVRKYNISFIAEEWNWQCCEINSVDKSTTKEFADQIGIECKYVELTSFEQEILGLRSPQKVIQDLRKDFGKITTKDQAIKLMRKYRIELIKDRQLVEGEWYKHIEDRLEENILFVTGKEHIYPVNISMWQSIGIFEKDLPKDRIFGINTLLNSKGINTSIIKEDLFPNFIEKYKNNFYSSMMISLLQKPDNENVKVSKHE